VTEDNEMNRKVLHDLLKRQNHTVFQAANGLEAIDICRAQRPELIFMDIQMDGIDGLETTRRIRHEPDRAIASIPIIALTGNVMQDDIDKFFSMGMNGFLPKPIEGDKLYKVIGDAAKGVFNVPSESERKKDQKPPIQKPAPVSTHPARKEEKPPEVISSQNEMTEMQKFIQLKDTPEIAEKYKSKMNLVMDDTIFQGLLDALGKEQVTSLIEGFSSKADEIIEQIAVAAAQKDSPALSARAHELKGMAANFGMREISEIAGKIEKAAKTSQTLTAIEEAKKLPDANARTKAEIKDRLS
jgi:CheY-like chemotaxis protein